MRFCLKNERLMKWATVLSETDSLVFVIAEIGENHNGSVKIAKSLIDGAVSAGCDAVKFEKRDSGDLRSTRSVGN